MKVGDKVKLTRKYKRHACSIVRGDCDKRFRQSSWWYKDLLSHRNSIGYIVDVSQYDTVRVVWANGHSIGMWLSKKDLVMT